MTPHALDVQARCLQPADASGAPARALKELGRICASARTEYLACIGHTNEAELPAGAVEERQTVLRALADRNVVTRRIVADSRMRTIAAPHSRVAGIAIAPRLPLSMAIIDRSIAVIPLDLDRFWAGFTVITQPLVVAAFVAQFETLWTALHATDPEQRPPEQFHAVLDVLSSGLADAPAARRLRVAPRTFSRRVADLLLELGANSRFQAGAEAARRGWI